MGKSAKSRTPAPWLAWIGCIGGLVALVGLIAAIVWRFSGLEYRVAQLGEQKSTSEQFKTIDENIRTLQATTGELTGKVDSREHPLIGEIRIWAGPSTELKGLEENGWFLCDGGAVNRMKERNPTNLFSLLKTLYGAGDGTDTFNLPNFQDRSPMGASLSEPREVQAQRPTSTVEGERRQDGGTAKAILKVEQLPSHKHTGTTGTASEVTLQVNDPGTNFNPGIFPGYSGNGKEAGGIGMQSPPTERAWPGQQHKHSFETDLTGGNKPIDNVHPYFAVWYVIFGGTETQRVPPKK